VVRVAIPHHMAWGMLAKASSWASLSMKYMMLDRKTSRVIIIVKAANRERRSL